MEAEFPDVFYTSSRGNVNCPEIIRSTENRTKGIVTYNKCIIELVYFPLDIY